MMPTSSRSREIRNRLRREAVRPAVGKILVWAQRGLIQCRAAGARIANGLHIPSASARVCRTATATWRRMEGLLPTRSLIGELLTLQLCFALLVGAMAIVGLWWTSTWVIEDNFRKWGDRWITELEDLGVPLFSTQNEDKFLQIETYIDSFPEIAFVRYYSPEGEIVFEDFPLGESSQTAALDTAYLDRLANETSAEDTNQLESSHNSTSLMRISRPIWSESFLDDGLLSLNLSDEQGVKVELTGFVEIGLNFSAYQERLSANIIISSAIGFLFLLILTPVSGIFFSRALKPLLRLQDPLRELAKGKTNFSVQASGHREIDVITDALNSTVRSLNERDEKLWQLANYDSLTGLINRHQFSEILVAEIDKTTREKYKSALLFVDLDQFKYINDTLGHMAGDRLLKKAAEHLKRGIRNDDVISRFGGDEFTILLSNVTRKDVKAISEGLVQDMREFKFIEDGHTFNIPCSIGAAMIGAGRLTAAEVLARSDMACHEAKNRGRNRVEFYRTSGAEIRQLSADVSWSQKIQTALMEDRFVILLQPIVDLDTGRPTHHEVLLRMRGSGKRLVPPAAFLPAASRFGLMTQIDEWVIRNAMSALMELRKKDEDLTFTLNISGNIFEDSDLHACIEENLAANSLPPESIMLEITEQVAVRNLTAAASQIADISRLGCKFAIDDFGAGYSSYSYLKTLPVHYIKIDGSFIKNLTTDLADQAIVRSISQIAQATDKKTIAEHVTDAKTYGMLHALGVNYAQGYYVGRPAARPSLRTFPVSIETARTTRRKAG
jgi:diguanylate cyclase (GGDEF)-like protein